LRANDAKTAKHVSENLGQIEQVEANEGMSYGVNDMRDGVNLSRTQVTRPLVLGTEVTNLPNLAGFLRFGRNLPVVRFSDKFRRLPSVAPDFVDRTTPPHRDAGARAASANLRGRRRHQEADDPAEAESPPAQGEMFDADRSPSQTEATPPGSSDAGGVAGAADETRASFPTVRILAPVPGSKRIELDYHDRTDGPRRKATPG